MSENVTKQALAMDAKREKCTIDGKEIEYTKYSLTLPNGIIIAVKPANAEGKVRPKDFYGI